MHMFGSGGGIPPTPPTQGGAHELCVKGPSFVTIHRSVCLKTATV